MENKLILLYSKENDVTKDEGYTLTISSSLFHYWMLDHRTPINLCFGNNIIPITVKKEQIEKQQLILNDPLMSRLMLVHKPHRYIAYYDEESSTIYLGPLIAILTEVYDQNDTKVDPPFPSIVTFCEELSIELQKLGGFFYVCGIQHFSEAHVNGYILDGNKWIQRPLPYPSIVYNRLHSRKLEKSSHFLDLKKELFYKQIPIFNSHFLAKDETYRLLKTASTLEKHLPLTEALSKEILIRMLKSYNVLYLKPIDGSQGRKIIQITTLDEGYQACASSGKQKGITYNFSTIHELWNWIEGFTMNKSYICQQGITFQTLTDTPLDFRVLCHKNHLNEWKVTSIVARKAKEGSIVANLAQGAEMLPAKQVLSTLYPQKTAKKLYEQLHAVAIDIASFLSKEADGYFGELGVDLGIDTEESIWLIEINSKPSKNSDTLSPKTKPSIKALIEYFIALSYPPLSKGDFTR